MKLREYPFQLFGFKLCEGTFGLEIETEAPSLSSYPEGLLNPNLQDIGTYVEGLGHVRDYKLWNKAWKGVIDNSLRNFGVEYVLKQPHSYEGTLRAIDEFSSYTKDVPFIQDAPGTSVHVHINMQDEQVLTLFTYITTWVLFENLLVEFSGETRRSNLFALPSRCAHQNIIDYKRILDQFCQGTRGNVFHAPESHSKYSALNVAPLSKLGSIEIRTLRGTTDPKILKQWVTILNDILIYSRENKPSDLLRTYHKNGAAGVINSVFSDTSFLADIDNVEARVDAQLLNTYSIVKAADWDFVRDVVWQKEETKSKKKPSSPLEMDMQQAQDWFNQQMMNYTAQNAPMYAIPDPEDIDAYTDLGDDDE